VKNVPTEGHQPAEHSSYAAGGQAGQRCPSALAGLLARQLFSYKQGSCDRAANRGLQTGAMGTFPGHRGYFFYLPSAGNQV